MVLSENGVNKWKWENAIIIFSIVYIGAATYMLKVLLDRIYRNADITINTVLQLKLYSIRSDELTIFFRAVSWFGYNGIIVIVTALCLFCIYKKYYYKFQIVFFTTTLGGYLNTILKEIIQRSRPQLILINFNKW